MTVDVNAGYDSEWIEAVKVIVESLKFDGIHHSNREEIVERSVDVWEKYMIDKGHLGIQFAELAVGKKVHMAATIKSRWDFRVFYIAILMGLTENRNKIN